MRLDGAVIDDIVARVESPGLVVEGDAEYSAYRIAVGSTWYDVGHPSARAELILGRAQFGDIDAFEAGVGGRFLLYGSESGLRPYSTIQVVSTFLDDVAGVDVGTQIAAAVGLGLEYDVTDAVALDLGFDLGIPLVEAKASVGGVETELSGLAVRVGIVIAL